MRYFIIAGEKSGDLHGSNLVKQLLKTDGKAEIFCWGGDLMEKAGAKLLMHYNNSAFMGFVIILKNIRTILGNLDLCKKQISDHKPDVIILIDYPAFNLRIAKYARSEGLKVFYFISPKFWAWNEGRVRKVKKYVDRMYVIFPFETEFYSKYGISVDYHGNPLLDEIENKIPGLPEKAEVRKNLNLGEKPIIALLAGSRRQEIESVLPHMAKVVKYFPDYQFVLAGVKNLPDELYRKETGCENIVLIKEKTYEILYVAESALVTSGTATLETALFDVPQVVCYRGDFFSMLIAWLLIRVKFVSLVNLILGYSAIKELLGYHVNEKRITSELKKILPGNPGREKILEDYKLLREKLGPAGASERIAIEMVRELRERVGEGEM
jgi:lipid-A-disaccharide synthase